MQALERGDSLSPGERMLLHFALGKAYADLNDHARAFEHLLQGNALKRAQIIYDEAATAALFERTEALFTPALITKKVVADLEGQARRIIAHCGLDWDERCLAFHQTERPVHTLSAMQVRQPIYDAPIGRWRVYEPFLGPLLAGLNSGAILPNTSRLDEAWLATSAHRISAF